VAAVVATHNRKSTTLRCLESLLHSADERTCKLRVIHVDDGSTDGTAEAFRGLFPEAQQILGDGNLYWAGAMRLGLELAYEDAPDYVLWLNDDVVLHESALRSLIALSPEPEGHTIAVAAMRDPLTGHCSYSAVRAQRSWRRTVFTRIEPSRTEEWTSGDTMNGNLVLVPRGVYERVGGFDPVFCHGMADFDYGLRATRRYGVAVHVSPEFLGDCAQNKLSESFRDPTLSFRARWAQVMSPKGLPPRQWIHFQRLHGGPTWMIPAFAPYIQVLSPHRRSPGFRSK
jgi:GT2 family glycosyltransferase